MKVKIEFSGGLELMFQGKKNIDLEIEERKGAEGTEPLLLEDVIEELRKNHLHEREELFI
jgi:hypothetical protein